MPYQTVKIKSLRLDLWAKIESHRLEMLVNDKVQKLGLLTIQLEFYGHLTILASQNPLSPQCQGREGLPILHGRRCVPCSQEDKLIKVKLEVLWTRFVFGLDQDLRGERAKEEVEGFDGEFQ